MKSFEIPIDRLQQLETRLRDRLDEVERLRSEFSEVSERLRGAAERLAASPLARLVASTDGGPAATISAVPHADAWSFLERHSTEKSPHDGYQRIASRIRREYREMRLSNSLLKEIHRCVVGHDTAGAGQWKTSNNFFPIYDEGGAHVSSILTTTHVRVPEYMDSLENRFISAWMSRPVSLVLLVGLYWLDLLAIHPFRDGNGRVARLAVLLLLCQSGHLVAKYASLEGYVNRRRTAYITTLRASLDGWPAAQHDPYMRCAYVLDLLRDAYLDISKRTDALISAIEQTGAVTAALAGMPGTFCTSDLQDRLPSVSDGILRLVLSRAREDGVLRASVDNDVVRWEKVGEPHKRSLGETTSF